jgi:hypothetical protein
LIVPMKWKKSREIPMTNTDIQDDRPMTPEEMFNLQARATATIMTSIDEARKSPLGLYKLLFRQKNGQPVIIKPFHEEWNNLVLNEKKVLICASRGLSKTSFLIAYAAWAIGINNNIRLKWVGPNDGNAEKRLSVIHELIDKLTSMYHVVFPSVMKTPKNDSKRPNTASQLNLIRDLDTPEPTIEAVGVTSSGTGGRSDIMLLDDICSHQNTILNPSMMPKVKDKVLSDWIPTVVADGQIVDIYTPWHADDTNSELRGQKVQDTAHSMARPAWAYSKYAHGKDTDPYFSIFPELWPSESLKEKRSQIGDQLYNMAYLLKLNNKMSSYVLQEHLRVYDKILASRVIPQARCILSFDPSTGRKQKAGDYFGVTVLLFHEWEEIGIATGNTRKRYLVLIPESYQVKIPTTYQTILIWHLAKKWNAAKILVEAKGMQTLDIWLKDQQEKESDLQAYDITPISFGSTGKGERLQAVTPMLNPVKDDPPVVYFHPKVVTSTPYPEPLEVGDTYFEILRDLRHQLLDFPTTHDDIMDSLTQGLGWIQRNWMPIGNQDQEDRELLSVTSIGF